MTNLSAKPQDTRPWYKKMRFVIPLSFLLVFIIGSQLDSTKEASASNLKTSNANVNAVSSSIETLTVKEQLQKEIRDIKENLDVSKVSSLTDPQDFTLAVAVYKAQALIIDQGKRSEDPESQELAKELERKVSVSQKKNFPILRKAFARLMKDKLWEHDIDVNVSGTNNSVLTFTGGIFAANKNIKDVQQMIWDQMEMLRFKRVNYKWYKYDDEYTYYNVESAKDAEVF
jgi:hypothetical protein